MKAVTVITLGVEALAASAAFYEGIGFIKDPTSDESIVWFSTGGTMLGLYPWDLLAEDASVRPEGSGFRGVTLSHCLPSKEAVDDMYQSALAAGATPVKPPRMVFWGGYSGYFADLDGHLWELAWNPYRIVDDTGIFTGVVSP